MTIFCINGHGPYPERNRWRQCKECQRKTSAERRAKDPKKSREAVRASARKTRANNRSRLRIIKRSPCMDCKRRHPVDKVEFDHRPGEVKVANVSRLISRNWRIIQAEIEKCDLVCARCHWKRTQQRRLVS